MIRIATAILTPLMLVAAADPKSPIAANPIVSFSGSVTRVEAIRPGEGMPGLVVHVNGTSTKVVLGSMRYLMERNFNIKAGAQVQVKGYKLSAAVFAIEVRLPADNLTLKLRDENGWPLWRGRGCERHGTSK
jgi:hypothetical protein